jgi:ABC-type Fe3+ transport system substrate-binding protein
MAANPKDPFAQAPELTQAFVDFLATPEGQSMKAKSMDFKRLVPAVVDEFVPLTAGLLVRFADKTEKMQAEKRLARGW